MNKDLIIYASSEDSLSYFPNNTSNSFRIQLPEEIDSHLLSRCALVEIHLPKSRTEQKIIYLDICEHSYVFGRKAPVLRRITGKLSKSVIFPERLYISTKPGKYNSLHIYILDENRQPINFDRGIAYCTLHFKQ